MLLLAGHLAGMAACAEVVVDQQSFSRQPDHTPIFFTLTRVVL
jgi:hypothetical protein